MQPHRRLFHHRYRGERVLARQSPHFPSPAPGNNKSTFYLYRFADPGHSISGESHHTLPLVSGFFHPARGFGGSSTLRRVSALPSFTLRLNKNTPLCGQTTTGVRIRAFHPRGSAPIPAPRGCPSEQFPCRSLSASALRTRFLSHRGSLGSE